MDQSNRSPRAPFSRRTTAVLLILVLLTLVVIGLAEARASNSRTDAPVGPTTTTTVPSARAAPALPVADQPLAEPIEAPTPGTVQQAEAIYDQVVPAPWRTAVPADFEIIGGYTSMSYTSGVIEIAQFHLTGPLEHALAIVAHEWGHQAAYRFGSGAFLGAAPSGFPHAGPLPEEAWADCVSSALTGIEDPSHGLVPCAPGAAAFASLWLAAGPPEASLLRVSGPR